MAAILGVIYKWSGEVYFIGLGDKYERFAFAQEAKRSGK